MTATGREHAGVFGGKAVLVTGGAGFIGSHLAQGLADIGAEVRVLDDLSTGRRENVPGAATLHETSLLDAPSVAAATAGCRFVFHLAAQVSVPESVEQPRRCAEINVTGTHNVLEAARDAEVHRVVFASSSAVYGGEPRLPSREEDPVDCWSPYAASKAAGEALARAFARSYDLSVVCLRYFNVFGPRQNPHSPYAAAIAAFAAALRDGRAPVIFGDGRQTRDFTPVDNAVLANLLAAAAPGPFEGDPINIGTGRRLDLLQVLQRLAETMGVTADPTFAPPRPGDVRDSGADLARAREVLGYEPVVSFEEGISRLVEASNEATKRRSD